MREVISEWALKQLALYEASCRLDIPTGPRGDLCAQGCLGMANGAERVRGRPSCRTVIDLIKD